MKVYTVKELKMMSIKELVKILVENSMSTNKSSKQLENVILNILAEREAAEEEIFGEFLEWYNKLYRKGNQNEKRK